MQEKVELFFDEIDREQAHPMEELLPGLQSGSGFVELFNISLSTYERKKKADQALDLVTSERLDRLASVAVLAEQVFEDKDAAAQWLERPNQALGGLTPLSLCDTEIGANQVRRVLHALEWGGVA